MHVSMLAPAVTAGNAGERGNSAGRDDDQERVERQPIPAGRMGRTMQADNPNCGQDQRDHRFHISSIDADRNHGKEENRKQEGRTCHFLRNRKIRTRPWREKASKPINAGTQPSERVVHDIFHGGLHHCAILRHVAIDRRKSFPRRLNPPIEVASFKRRIILQNRRHASGEVEPDELSV
jgi:hypothetical protein